MISFTSPAPGPTPIIEPLTGTFNLTITSLEEAPPNTAFAFQINRLAFCSSPFMVTAMYGGMSSTTSDPLLPEVYLPATIDGQEVTVWSVGGGQFVFRRGPLDGFPETITVDLCEDVHFATTCEEIRHGAGFGYTLRLLATKN